MQNYIQKIPNYENLQLEIERAKIRCMSEKDLVCELLKEPISIFNKKPSIVYRLIEISNTLEEDSIKNISELTNYIIKSSETIASKEKYKTDNYLRELIKILSEEHAINYAYSFMEHKRKNRRLIGLKYFKNRNFDNNMKLKFLNKYIATNDQIFLEYIARNVDAELLKNRDVEYILGELDEEYWKCRIVEKLINTREINEFMKSIFQKYDYATFYAMGRTRNKDVLKYISQNISKYYDDLDSLKLIIWALGKVQAIDEINVIEKSLTKLSKDSNKNK